MPSGFDVRPSEGPRKLHAPATLRNRAAILEVLQDILPETGAVLEVGAGSGEHAVYFAQALPGVLWQPTEAEPECLASITAYVADAALANLRPPFRLDARALPWAGIRAGGFDAVVAINVVHISPWATCCGLIAGATAALTADGILFLYGPYKREGRHTAVSNALFEEQLWAMDPRFGVRDVADVAAEARLAGLDLEREVLMPANNLSLVFRKRSESVAERRGGGEPTP